MSQTKQTTLNTWTETNVTFLLVDLSLNYGPACFCRLARLSGLILKVKERKQNHTMLHDSQVSMWMFVPAFSIIVMRSRVLIDWSTSRIQPQRGFLQSDCELTSTSGSTYLRY